MLFRLIRPLRLLVRAFTAADTPRQLALGFALGMMVGLVPKGNLTAVALSLLVLSLQVNLSTAALAALLFSWAGILFDPLADRIGETVLTAGTLQPVWAFLYDLPLMPWTRFNNTVVFGSLVLGGCLFYPTYHFSRLAFERCRPWVVERLKKHRASRVLSGADTAASWSNR